MTRLNQSHTHTHTGTLLIGQYVWIEEKEEEEDERRVGNDEKLKNLVQNRKQTVPDEFVVTVCRD